MSVVDFLNHGTLPFVGRSDLRDRLVRFWNAGTTGEGMHLLLLIGEAGAGKSRLVEEGVDAIARSGAAIVQTRLYPESPTALLPLLSRALWRYAQAHPELRLEVDETFGSVLFGLRRLCRLRPSILIIEDLHLLGGGGVGDLGVLLDALADEPLPVIMTSRPLELAARSVLERHSVIEANIPGLDREAARDLWTKIFSRSPAEVEVEALMRATAGNPLAIRSALRGAVRSGTLAYNKPTRQWCMAISHDAFAESLERSVSLLSEGMAAHLEPQEGKGAAAIALLGELVARESAIAMVGSADLVDRLIFKGILKTGSVAIPHLQGGDRSCHPILSFTHSLVHRRFVDSSSAPRSRLIQIIADGLPLYSVLPFQILLDRTGTDDLSVDVVLRSIERGLDTALSLDYGPDWELASMVLESVTGLFEGVAPMLQERGRRIIEARLVIRRNALLHRGEPLDQKQAMVARMLHLTESPDDDQTRRLRLAALVNNSMAASWIDNRLDPDAIEQIRLFVADHPELRLTEPYLAYLNQIVMYGAIKGEEEVLHRVEIETEEMLSDPSTGDEFRRNLRRAVYPDLVGLYADQEELDRRMRQLDELEREGEDRYTSGILFCKLALLEQTAHLNQAAMLCREAIPYFRDRGIQLNLAYAERVDLMIRLVHGLSFEQGAHEGEQVCSRGTTQQADQQRLLYGIQMAIAASLTGRVDEARSFIRSFLGGRDLPFLSLRLLMESEHEGIIGWLVQGGTFHDGRYGELLAQLGSLFNDPAAGIEEARQAINAIARHPLLRMTDLHIRLAIAHTVVIAGSDAVAGLVVEVRAVILEGLEWLAARSLPAAIRGLLGTASPFLSRRDIASWRSRLGKMDDSAGEGKRGGGVRMLGVIEIDQPECEPIRPKGIRLKTLLALVVADRLLDSPLGAREFALLVAGSGSDPDDARKTLNLAVHRLRELIGHELIITRGETPRLNDELIDADLWRIDRLLDRVDRGMREGAMHRAQPMLLEALGIWRGEIPFPALYDEFFEAARDDFETRMRGMVLRLSRALMREEDALSAEELLRAGLAAMPEEPELVDLLVDALTALGKRVEAERLRLTADL